MSRNEELLSALLNDTPVDFTPQSRAEAYLKACCDKCGCSGLPEPISRNDVLLYALADKLSKGGLPEGISMGEFTPTTDTETVAPIEYGLEKFPNYLFIYAKDKSPESFTGEHAYAVTRSIIGVYWDDENNYYTGEYDRGFEFRDGLGSSLKDNVDITGFPDVPTDNDTNIDPPVSNKWKYEGGVTYVWIAIRVEA